MQDMEARKSAMDSSKKSTLVLELEAEMRKHNKPIKLSVRDRKRREEREAKLRRDKAAKKDDKNSKNSTKHDEAAGGDGKRDGKPARRRDRGRRKPKAGDKDQQYPNSSSSKPVNGN